MLKQDFLMRIIQQLGEGLRRAMKKRADADLDGALNDLGVLYHTLLGLDAWMVRAMSIPSLIGLLRDDAEIGVLAALVAEEALLAAASAAPSSPRLTLRALDLFEEAARRGFALEAPCREALERLAAMPSAAERARSLL